MLAAFLATVLVAPVANAGVELEAVRAVAGGANEIQGVAIGTGALDLLLRASHPGRVDTRRCRVVDSSGNTVTVP